MNTPEEILKKQPEEVQQMFRYWMDFMEHRVEFWTIPGDLDIHTQGHCERVLLHALRIGNQRVVKLRPMIALAHAAIFHDTRRKDNYLDTGHGDRAADYYHEFCEKQHLHFLPEAFAAIKFHDRDDHLGEEYIAKEAKDEAPLWLEVYRDFKDADALDRLRLGTWCLDERFLRSDEARQMPSFAQQLVEATIPRDELERTYKLTEPFRPASPRP